MTKGDEALERAVRSVASRSYTFEESINDDTSPETDYLIECIFAVPPDVVEQICRDLLASLPPTPPVSRILAEALEHLIVKYEAGTNHTEAAFNPDCQTCLILRDLRAALAQYNASPSTSPEGELVERVLAQQAYREGFGDGVGLADLCAVEDGWLRSDARGRGSVSVIDEIAAERRRQIEVEGWTPEHDDEHAGGQLANAAACYAAPRSVHFEHEPSLARGVPAHLRLLFWPWDFTWWKPKSRRHDLIRAAALLVAEVERLDRAAAAPSPASAKPEGGER